MINHLSHNRNALATGLIAFALSIAGLGPVSQLAAQVTGENELVSDCMSRTNSDGTVVSILAPQQNQLAMREAGYEPARCSDTIGDADEQRKWRDDICTIAATSSETIQSAFERQMGARPATLCGMAERVIGSWSI